MPSIDKETAIKLVQEQLERFLPGELEAQKQPLRDFSSGMLKAWRSGVATPDGTIDQGKMDDLAAAAAAGDKEALSEVASIAIWLLQILQVGHPLPESFRKLEIELWYEKLPKLKRPRNLARDIQYGIAIHGLQEYGFSPTRNRSAHGDPNAPASACSIVSEASARMGEDVSEQTLEKIWEKNAWRR